jgi:ParB family chromosome partitioning protein
MNAKTVTRAVKGMTLRLDDIEIPSSVRPYNAAAVVELSNSIAAIGLQSAPTVIERGGRYVLVAGRHRIEALRLLKHESVLVRVVDFDDREAKLWTIAENLHRAELTTEQRYEQIAEYARLAKEKREEERVSAHSGQKPQGGRPESGDALAARDLGIARQQIQRAQEYAALPQDVKERAIAEGVGPSKLLRVTDGGDPGASWVIAPTARSLRDLTNISAGEFAHWIKITTPNDRPHVIRVLEQAAAILRDEIEGRTVPEAAA